MKNGGDSAPLGMIHGVIKTFFKFLVVPLALAPPGLSGLEIVLFHCVIVSDASESGICPLDSDCALLVCRVSVEWGRCSLVDVG